MVKFVPNGAIMDPNCSRNQNVHYLNQHLIFTPVQMWANINTNNNINIITSDRRYLQLTKAFLLLCDSYGDDVKSNNGL